MGSQEEAVGVVLDTNVLLSALLFGGPVSRLVSLWKRGDIKPAFSRATFDEFRRALAYPKFKLTAEEINLALREEVLPFFEVVSVPQPVERICPDNDDDIFVACALAAGARFLVTGDKRLLALKRHRSVRITTPSDLLRKVR